MTNRSRGHFSLSLGTRHSSLKFSASDDFLHRVRGCCRGAGGFAAAIELRLEAARAGLGLVVEKQHLVNDPARCG